MEHKKNYPKVGKVQRAKTPRPPIEVPISEEQPPVKNILITTDGSNVQIKYANINFLEMEMMMIKALAHIRERK